MNLLIWISNIKNQVTIIFVKISQILSYLGEKSLAVIECTSKVILTIIIIDFISN